MKYNFKKLSYLFYHFN